MSGISPDLIKIDFYNGYTKMFKHILTIYVVIPLMSSKQQSIITNHDIQYKLWLISKDLKMIKSLNNLILG